MDGYMRQNHASSSNFLYHSVVSADVELYTNFYKNMVTSAAVGI